MKEEVFTICISGDPVYDVYKMGTLYSQQYNNRFVQSGYFIREGGVANIANNVEALLQGQESTTKLRRMYESNTKYWPTLERYVVSDNQIIMEAVPNIGMLEDTYLPGIHIDNLYWIPSARNGLIIGDYNKGTTNRKFSNRHEKLLKTKPKFDYIVIDSRYGTYWPGWLDYACMKILHATGEELGRHNPSLFNYTFHTDGHQDIQLLHYGEHVATINVPSVSFIDPTGAGDTFTACIAAYLATHCNQAWDTELMKDAVEYAVPLCQQIIKHLGVGVPKLPTTEEITTEG